MSYENAYTELMEYLEPNEIVEAIVFGAWGWRSSPTNDDDWEPGYCEPDPTPVPFDMRGKILSFCRKNTPPFRAGMNCGTIK